MSSSTLVFFMPLLASLASAVHYYGSSSTFNTRRTSNGTFRVDIRYRVTEAWCSSNHWSCSHGDCGYSVADQVGIIDSSSNGQSTYDDQWCETEKVETRFLQTNSPFEMSYHDCCWIPTADGSDAPLSLLTYVDLGTRSDTGEPNRSPDIAVLPFLRVRQNCPRLYNLMSVDPDGDQVQCRYGTAQGTECGACRQHQGFHLDQDSCTLHYDYTSTPGVHGFELVVGDFPTRRITLAYTNGSQAVRSPLRTRPKRGFFFMPPPPGPAPTTAVTNTPTPRLAWRHALSQLTLQFSLIVDPDVPSCVDGVYLPKFLPPTPRDGERLRTEVNKELEIRVKAHATNSTVYNVIISGPLNITKHRTTHDEFVINWTPVQEDLGDTFPICFAAESMTGLLNVLRNSSEPSPSPASHHNHTVPGSAQYEIYQSEMRCVVVEVVRKHIDAHVICTENTMTVELNKASLPGLQQDHLRLSDPSNTVCSLQTHSNSTHVVATFPLSGCGTQIEEDGDSLHFRNEITSVENVSDIITRRHQVEVKFCCQYSKRENMSLGFFAHRSNVTVKEKGFGTFTYQFEFFQDSRFDTMIDPSSYPLEFDVGEKIYMEIDATSSLNETELFVESCSAAPYDTPNYSPVYPIIENGCIMDPTVNVYSSSHKKYFRFGLEAFKFIGLYDQVYISCSVMVCEAGEPNSRCSQGCLSSPNAPSNAQYHHRKRREAAIQTASHFISQGPLRLRGTSATTVTNLNMNLVFIAGCLLAAVGMLCVVLIYKTKMSSNYQSLP